MRRRRKKPQGDRRVANKPGSPPPLQPVYPDMEQQARPQPAPLQPESSAPREPQAPPPEAQQAAPAAEPERQGQRKGRRRRGRRGGRGRQRGAARQAATVPQPQPEVEEPEVPTEPPQEQPAAVAVPPAPAVEQLAPPVRAPAAKPSKGVVVLAIGLPGSGKSSWFKRRGVTPLSSDMIRMLLFDNIAEQRHQDLVFATLRSLLRARLLARMPANYVDATNLSPKERRGWIKMAREFGYDVHAVFFDVPLEVCQERNLRRGRVVPDDVMQRMANKLRPPTFEEGLAKITVVRVKQKEEPENF